MNAQQIARLDLALSRGNLTGVSSTYHLLRNEMGAAAPTKEQISTYMNQRPSVQINKTTKKIAGKKMLLALRFHRRSRLRGAQPIARLYLHVTIQLTRSGIQLCVCLSTG